MRFYSIEGKFDLAKELSRDKPALETLYMHRTTASYKMAFGLCKTIKDQLLSKLKTTKFSLNLDEATNNNQTRVLTVLASYHNEQSHLVVVASSVLHAVKNEFENHELPWKNAISILMDSCNVTLGSKRI